MKKQWRNIGIIVAIIVAAALALNFIPSLLAPPSFEAELSEMSEIWVEKGLSSEPLHTQPEALASLSDAELSSLKTGISSFYSTANFESTKSLAEVYLALIDFTRTAKMEKTAATELETADLCEESEVFEDYSDKLTDFVSKLDAFETSNNFFAASYPEEAGLAGVGFVDNNVSSRTDSAVAYSELLAYMQEDC